MQTLDTQLLLLINHGTANALFDVLMIGLALSILYQVIGTKKFTNRTNQVLNYHFS